MSGQGPRRARRRGLHGWRLGLVIGLAVVVVLGGGTAAALGLGLLPNILPTTTPPESTPPPTTLPTLVPVPTLTPRPFWPLTGVPGDVVERPTLVVKVENSIDARPQQGLEDADIVWEEMVEAGITRYVAMFHSTLPEQILPIRSIRPMDGPIAGWTGGLMVFSGGQEAFYARARSDGLQLISMDFGAAGFTRVKGRPSPHDVVGDPQIFLSQADANHQSSPPAFASFARPDRTTAVEAGAPASQVDVVISSQGKPHWTWDADSSRWLRFEGDKPAVTVDGTQLSAVNVLCLTVQVKSDSQVDVNGVRVPESIVVGSGAGLVATNGSTAIITWQKASETAPWQFFDAAGQPLVLAPGNTWVELVPTTGSYLVS